MKISLNWLSEFVEWQETDPQAIADRLTLSVAEVEHVSTKGALLAHCCVGKVLSITKHPNADKLSLADVETDKGTKRVVCGGTNLKEGMLVAFAHIGATVKWHGGELMTLAPVKIRGEESEGMICAAEELGLEGMFSPSEEDGERPIVNLGKMKVGADLRKALDLTDTTLDISNTAITNRPDLFSHSGFARECVAVGLATWKKGQPKTPNVSFSSAPLPFAIKCTREELVPRYAACCLKVREHGETPDWMKQRLEAVGIRSINLPVDITNYVMMETGVPLHAFDRDQLQGKTLTFRETDAGEAVTTLDGVKRTLDEGIIVFEDNAGIFDLCGIMGDARSATTDATRSFFLHAPSFSSLHIRKAMQSVGHRTDASTIFEKGVPPVMVEHALKRAIELFLEHCPGANIESEMLTWGSDGEPEPITLSQDYLNGMLGMELPAKEVKDILESLGCTVKSDAKKRTLVITPPLHRLRDLRIPADLVEEIARVHGYDRSPEQTPTAPIRIPVRDLHTHQLRRALKGDGYLEILPLSLVSAELLTKCGMDPKEAVRIANPLNEDFALMQTSTLPQLLVHAKQNILLSHGPLKTFHRSHVFHVKKPEHTELGLLYVAKQETALIDDPFLHLSQDLTVALQEMGYEAEYRTAKEHAAYMHPGRHADVIVDGKAAGSMFEVHPSIRQRFGFEHRAAAATVNLSQVLSKKPNEKYATPIPQFPAISYDVTLPWSQDKEANALLQTLKAKSALLEEVRVADLYQGKQHTSGAYNLTLRFTYRAADRTLTEEEAKKEHEKLLADINH